MPKELSGAIVELKRDLVVESVRVRLEQGHDPLAILEECRRGMVIVGERFQAGDYFLSELLLSAELFKEAVAMLEPHLGKGRAAQPRGSVVLATMRGDIHDLGKNILGTLLRAHGFAVYDLGTDVSPQRVVEQVRELRPGFVGFSALITTAFASMKEAAELLGQEGLREGLRLMVGGGVTSPAVRDYVGADFQSVDAMEGVAYCLAESGERRSSCPANA